MLKMPIRLAYWRKYIMPWVIMSMGNTISRKQKKLSFQISCFQNMLE
jgi:hypothetical protein